MNLIVLFYIFLGFLALKMRLLDSEYEKLYQYLKSPKTRIAPLIGFFDTVVEAAFKFGLQAEDNISVT